MNQFPLRKAHTTFEDLAIKKFLKTICSDFLVLLRTWRISIWAVACDLHRSIKRACMSIATQKPQGPPNLTRPLWGPLWVPFFPRPRRPDEAVLSAHLHRCYSFFDHRGHFHICTWTRPVHTLKMSLKVLLPMNKFIAKTE